MPPLFPAGAIALAEGWPARRVPALVLGGLATARNKFSWFASFAVDPALAAVVREPLVQPLRHHERTLRK